MRQQKISYLEEVVVRFLTNAYCRAIAKILSFEVDWI